MNANTARTRKRAASGWALQEQRRRVLARDGGRCRECGAEATEVDHVRALHQGGTNADENLRALCGPCHARKTAAEAQARAAGRPSRKRPPERHPGEVGR